MIKLFLIACLGFAIRFTAYTVEEFEEMYNLYKPGTSLISNKVKTTKVDFGRFENHFFIKGRTEVS